MIQTHLDLIFMDKKFCYAEFQCFKDIYRRFLTLHDLYTRINGIPKSINENKILKLVKFKKIGIFSSKLFSKLIVCQGQGPSWDSLMKKMKAKNLVTHSW